MEEYFDADYARMIADANESRDCKRVIDKIYRAVRNQMESGNYNASTRIPYMTSEEAEYAMKFFRKRKFWIDIRNSIVCISWYGDD